ncbi:MAG: ribonuclease III [Deltaproteobacteria bacterium]|nr:ribonuclease III [Deltaproteobacteria bacterium]
MTLADLQVRVRYVFHEPALLEQALTHKSHAAEGRSPAHNERLEFLGDSVLQLLVTHLIYSELGDAPEGTLTRVRSELVRAETLADAARTLGLGPLMRLGNGEELMGGRDKEKILADAFEALLGAIYLDSGGALTPLRPLIEATLGARLRTPGAVSLGRDPKSTLQERSMARWKVMPRYTPVSEEGLPHTRVYTVQVSVTAPSNDVAIITQGTGPSKKLAEREAAVAALALIDQRLAKDAAEAQAALDDLSELDLFPVQEPQA